MVFFSLGAILVYLDIFGTSTFSFFGQFIVTCLFKIIFKLNEESDSQKRKLLADSINQNGISVDKLTNDMNSLSSDMCRIQMGDEKQLRELEIKTMISNELSQMEMAADQCLSGK